MQYARTGLWASNNSLHTVECSMQGPDSGLFPTAFIHQNADYIRMQYAIARLRAVPICIHTTECSMQRPDSWLLTNAFIHQNAVCKGLTLGCSQLHSHTRMQYARTTLRAIPKCIHTLECSICKDQTPAIPNYIHTPVVPTWLQSPLSTILCLFPLLLSPLLFFPFLSPPPLFDLFCWAIFTPPASLPCGVHAGLSPPRV
jgi:hypothetical protein